MLNGNSVLRTDGTGVYFSEKQKGCPPVLKTYLNMANSLPNSIIILRSKTYTIPYVKESKRLMGRSLGNGVYHLTVKSGFMEEKQKVYDMLMEAERLDLLTVRIIYTTLHHTHHTTQYNT